MSARAVPRCVCLGLSGSVCLYVCLSVRQGLEFGPQSLGMPSSRIATLSSFLRPDQQTAGLDEPGTRARRAKASFQKNVISGSAVLVFVTSGGLGLASTWFLQLEAESILLLPRPAGPNSSFLSAVPFSGLLLCRLP